MHAQLKGLGIALGALLLASAAQAGTTPPQNGSDGANIVIGGARLPRAEGQAQSAYEAAMRAYSRGSYPALRPHLERLRRALDNAPKTYPTIEHAGRGRWIVRADDMGEAILRSAMASQMAEEAEPGVRATVDTGPNVYPAIALLLGSEAVERHAYDEAIAVLDKGLALQPDYLPLSAEKMGAIQGQRRWADALAVGDAALQASGLEGFMGSPGVGLVQRRRGFSLVELNRLDEAQAAYEASLKSDPDSEVAKGELEYIAKLRAGAAPTTAMPNIAQQAPAT